MIEKKHSLVSAFTSAVKNAVSYAHDFVHAVKEKIDANLAQDSLVTAGVTGAFVAAVGAVSNATSAMGPLEGAGFGFLSGVAFAAAMWTTGIAVTSAMETNGRRANKPAHTLS